MSHESLPADQPPIAMLFLHYGFEPEVATFAELCRAVASEKGADAGAVRDDVLSVLGKLGRFGQRTPN